MIRKALEAMGASSSFGIHPCGSSHASKGKLPSLPSMCCVIIHVQLFERFVLVALHDTCVGKMKELLLVNPLLHFGGAASVLTPATELAAATEAWLSTATPGLVLHMDRC